MDANGTKKGVARAALELSLMASAVLLSAGAARGDDAVERTAHGVRLVRDGAVVWNFEIETPEGRPFFHPLTLPGGRPLTESRPSDHCWHLGYWFSWKFINGVNYWEPADAERKGCESEGETRVERHEVKIDGLACDVDMRLRYGPRGGSPVLSEKRRVVVDPPDAKGGYVITSRHSFTALADVVLERTPPWGSVESGKWGGGYAGMTLRLDAATAGSFSVRGFGGGASPGECTGRETTFLDFTDSATGEGVTFTRLRAPSGSRFYLWPDKRMINPSPIYEGPLTLKKGETLELAYRLAVHGSRALPKSPADMGEKLGRGLVAGVTPEGTHVGWRMLPDDARDVGFTLWRRVNGVVEKVTDAPVVQTSDVFLSGFTDASAEYSLDGKTFTPVRCVEENGFTFIRIPLADTNATVQAAAVGDLDGDGAYDYVVKTPHGSIDPWELVWHRSESTYALEAHDSAGRLLWKRDLGWNIEQGIWYSPFLVADLDGDGRAEVVAKTAPTDVDHRDADGRVHEGPEYLTVMDGLTGADRARTAWIPRAEPYDLKVYNHYDSRNQIALAKVRGNRPLVVIERGTYGRMIIEAYRLSDAGLELVWRWDNDTLPRRFKGQGDHACLCEDVDGDGCDEILVGSLTLDHDGTVLWCSGRGHSDAHYYGDIDPARPGLELAFIYESRQRDGGGILLADPVTGEDIWKLAEPTRHVHGCGICADIDPAHPGLEIYGQEVDQSTSTKENTHPQSDRRWFFAADGTLLCAGTNCTYNYKNGVRNAFWDADLQRENFRGAVKDHEGVRATRSVSAPMLVADLLGDWREEFVVAQKGELRIYTTDIPAMDRRVSLMCDPSYRSRITMWPSGYDQQPILQYVPSAVAPNVSVRLSENASELWLDVTSPLDSPLKGTLAVTQLPKDWSVDLPPVEIDLGPGGVWTRRLPIRRPPNPKGRFVATVTLTRPSLPPLIVRQPFRF